MNEKICGYLQKLLASLVFLSNDEAFRICELSSNMRVRNFTWVKMAVQNNKLGDIWLIFSALGYGVHGVCYNGSKRDKFIAELGDAPVYILLSLDSCLQWKANYFCCQFVI